MENAQQTLREKILFYTSLALRVSIVVVIVLSVVEMQWLTLFLAVVALVSTFLPSIMEKRLKVSMPTEFEFVITFFLYLALFLGSTQGFYQRFSWWDTALHSVSGLILGFIGFIILYTLHAEGKLEMSPSLLALFSFAFALALGTIWEIFEFMIDIVFDYGMQPSEIDTMKDLILDSGGAFFTAVLGYVYMKNHEEDEGLFGRAVQSFLERNIEKLE